MTHLITIDLREVSLWRYCPKCGSELLEIYPGDYKGFTSCMNDHDDECSVDFDVIREEQICR